jgi:hypothetical protein
MDNSALQHEDTRPRDSAAPVQDSDVAVTKGNYQQTAPTAKMLVGPGISMSLAIRHEKLEGWTSYLHQPGRDGALSTQVCVLRRSVSINPERLGDGIWRARSFGEFQSRASDDRP